MTIITCVQREGAAAIYVCENLAILCEHVRDPVPWDHVTQARTKVRVTALDKQGRLTKRSVVVPTSSYVEAARHVFGVGDCRVQHLC